MEINFLAILVASLSTMVIGAIWYNPKVFGTIWMKAGTWFDRGEYDGSEWWEFQKCPNMPNEFLKREKIKVIIND